MNEYDSTKIVAIMQQQGFTLTPDYTAADLVILNTCSVRAKAEEKLFSELGMIYKTKKIKKHLIIGVGGCVSVQEKENIFKRAPYVNFIFGPQTYHLLPQMYAHALQHQKTIDISSPPLEKFKHFPPPQVAFPTAYVTVVEGCNRFCSYCVVPFTRGREISRPFSDVIQEVEILAKQGVKEIYFLGQNVNNYRDQNYTLIDLIKATAEIESLQRIRFITSHPQTFTQELINIFSLPKVANHLHLPIQSGSNRILQAMRRGYTAEEFKEKIAVLRNLRPHISISSDFIVGFPGETEADFDLTLQIVRELKFDNSFSFMYSPRPKTLAATLKDDVPLAEKKRHLALLQKELKIHAHNISQAMLSSTQNILVTNTSKKNSQEFSGRTENNRVVNFQSKNTKQNLIGQMVTVKITKILPNCLRGTPITN